MLRIAVQSKGRLFEDTMALLSEAGIKVSSSKRTLLVQSSNFPIEVLYLRDDDIPQSVATGVADLGIVGQNEYEERQEDAEVIRWIRPPANQLGIFWQAGQQYTPDFLVGTANGKYMVEIQDFHDAERKEVLSKAREGVKWCQYATLADPTRRHGHTVL